MSGVGLLVQDLGDPRQRHPDLPVHQHPVNPGDVGGVVETVAAPRPRTGPDQSDLVPVMQGADGHTYQPRDGPDGQFLHLLILSHTSSLRPHAR